MKTFAKVQQNFTKIQLELDPNKILFAPNNEGIIVYEIFKDIPEYENIYQISTFGRAKSLSRRIWNGKVWYISKERILKSSIDTNKYLVISIRKERILKTFQIHQLIAITFLNHKPNGHKVVCDHIDHIKTNNFKWNLQLITNRENSSKDRIGTSKYTGVSWCKTHNKWVTVIQIKGKNKHLGRFINELEASKAYKHALNNI